MVDQNDLTGEKNKQSVEAAQQERRNSIAIKQTNEDGDCESKIPILKDGVPVVAGNKKSRQIGFYILEKKLGEGTFGKVKLATHIYTNQKVAIKILEKDRIIDVSDVERVSREIHILKLLRHSNIIQLYEIIETPKQLFLVMEYASGGELFDYIVANQRVKEREAARIFLQILSGIEYIHKLNIVHRDMKPENLLLNHDKSIKIVDFGLSNTYKKNELLKTACGSPCYAAPEMIAGKKYEGLGVDIWSCGVILYALLCGYLPFEDANTANLYKKILSGEFTVSKSVSAEAKDLLKNILNTDPAKRFSVDSIRAHPWCNQYKLLKTPEGIIVGYNRIPVDQEILQQLSQFNFSLDHAQKCIDANKHNHITTCYYLLLKKHIKSGGKSLADISSDDFDSTLLLPNKRPAKTPHKDQFGSGFLGAHADKENLNDTHIRRSALNSRKESRDQSLTKEAVTAVLLNNTASLNAAAQSRATAGSSIVDSKNESLGSSKYPSYKSSKRNSIQTNRLAFNSENTHPNTTKQCTQNQQAYISNAGSILLQQQQQQHQSNHQIMYQQQQQHMGVQINPNTGHHQQHQTFTRQPIQQQLQYILPMDGSMQGSQPIQGFYPPEESTKLIEPTNYQEYKSKLQPSKRISQNKPIDQDISFLSIYQESTKKPSIHTSVPETPSKFTNLASSTRRRASKQGKYIMPAPPNRGISAPRDYIESSNKTIATNGNTRGQQITGDYLRHKRQSSLSLDQQAPSQQISREIILTDYQDKSNLILQGNLINSSGFIIPSSIPLSQYQLNDKNNRQQQFQDKSQQRAYLSQTQTPSYSQSNNPYISFTNTQKGEQQSRNNENYIKMYPQSNKNSFNVSAMSSSFDLTMNNDGLLQQQNNQLNQGQQRHMNSFINSKGNNSIVQQTQQQHMRGRSSPMRNTAKNTQDKRKINQNNLNKSIAIPSHSINQEMYSSTLNDRGITTTKHSQYEKSTRQNVHLLCK